MRVPAVCCAGLLLLVGCDPSPGQDADPGGLAVHVAEASAPRGYDGTAAAPTARGVAAALSVPLADRRLGPVVSGYVVDAVSGEVLLDRGSGRAATPASVAKVATAVAALHVLGPDRRLTTRVVRGPGRSVVLVGGGDPSLAGARTPPGYPPRARLADLAAATARALGPRARVRLVVDDSLFRGPRTAPGWKPAYVAQGSVAAVSALAVDGARLRPDRDAGTADPRAPDPALHAGAQLRAALVSAGVAVVGRLTRGTAPVDAEVLAQVASPPVGVLVERLLGSSDNDLAEALARHVAVDLGEPPTFAGAAAALRTAMRRLGIGSGLRLADASGLSVLNRATPQAVARLMLLAIDPQRPALRAAAAGLPVAGFTGTLEQRFASAAPGLGVVRAKTGTLTGVSTLAGYVVDADGRLLVFVFVADRAPGTLPAQRALDRLAATLARCGCR